MRCIGGNAETSEAWRCNYNAIATDGSLAVENFERGESSRMRDRIYLTISAVAESYSISEKRRRRFDREKVRWLLVVAGPLGCGEFNSRVNRSEFIATG